MGYYLHWSRDQVMMLDHLERRRWCNEVSRINKQLGDDGSGPKNVFDI